jgi:uncharacterized protein (DUF302 family)
MTVFARLDHRAAAEEVGLSLRPTELLIFGNARAGTPLMQAAQTIGIDLPLKALVWQGADGTTWFAYNDPDWLMARHGVGADTEGVRRAMVDALAATAREVIGDDDETPRRAATAIPM